MLHLQRYWQEIDQPAVSAAPSTSQVYFPRNTFDFRAFSHSMAAQRSNFGPLEDLRRLINTSIDSVLEDLACQNDPPLDINSQQRHPIRDRYDEKTSRALKCLSSAGVLLRALCDPEAHMHDVMFNFHDHTALFVACQADLANLIGDCNCSADEISEKTGIEADKISRFLRALSNIHIFKEVAPNVFCNNELSLLLQSESRMALVGLCAEESRLSSCKAWDALTHPDFKSRADVNKSAFNIAYNTDLSIFDYWRDVRPDLGKRGAKAFTGKGLNYEQYFALYPWAHEQDGTLIVDVGGGIGGATLPIIRRFRNLRLQIQDVPENEENFKAFLKSDYADISKSGRAAFLSHNFFQPQPTTGADIYFLRHVIHNWQDTQAIELLRHLATALSPTSKILICEHVIMPAYRGGHHAQKPVCQNDDSLAGPAPLLYNWGAGFTSRLDLQVLACVNAKQRSMDDFVELADASGLVVRKFWRNHGDEVLVECHLKGT